MTDFNFNEFTSDLVYGDKSTVINKVSQALDSGVCFHDIYSKAIIPAINQLVRLYSEYEFGIPELIIGFRATKAAYSLKKENFGEELPTAVRKAMFISLPENCHPLHCSDKLFNDRDILVPAMIFCAGYHTISCSFEMGTSIEKIVQEIKENKPNWIVINTGHLTLFNAQALIQTLEQDGLKQDLKVIVLSDHEVMYQYLSGFDAIASTLGLFLRAAKSLVNYPLTMSLDEILDTLPISNSFSGSSDNDYLPPRRGYHGGMGHT